MVTIACGLGVRASGGATSGGTHEERAALPTPSKKPRRVHGSIGMGGI
jgi:hypothetical protein